MNQDNDKKLELDHEYDGIKELDHPLPKWWLFTFYGAILFGIGYFAHYTLGSGKDLKTEYSEELTVHKQLHAQYLERIENFDQTKFLTAYNDAPTQLLGEELFVHNCAACHAMGGAGDIGPNLTDLNWMYAQGTPDTIYPFILSGNPGNGMPSWADKLEEEEIYAILAYIMAQQGTTHARAKPPQGDEYPKWQNN